MTRRLGAAEQVVAEVAAGEPEPVRAKLATFLKQVPLRVRQSQRRPADPSGRTIRPGLVVSRPADLIPFVPDQVPQFQAGVELLGFRFEEQEDRPADAAVLAEKLEALLKPPVVKPPEPPKEVVNSIGMKLKLVPAGEFLMGSPDSDEDALEHEAPPHRVRITQPIYLGIYQATRGQFGRFVEATRYQTDAEKDGQGGYGREASSSKWVQSPQFTWRSAGFEQTDDHPVVNVSWYDASAFCEWLSCQEGQPYRLLTEAEWEYACRAGTTMRFSFGDSEIILGQYAWYLANSNNQTHPVGEKKANAFGLHDLHGNVWEWCWDEYDAEYYKKSPASDPRGPEQACHRVFRGGGWFNVPQDARSAYRDGPLRRTGSAPWASVWPEFNPDVERR